MNSSEAPAASETAAATVAPVVPVAPVVQEDPDGDAEDSPPASDATGALRLGRGGLVEVALEDPDGLVSGEAWLDSSYHLGPRSNAIDAGVDAGVTVDIDGDMRPIHDGFDIGADELTAYLVYLPLLRRDQ